MNTTSTASGPHSNAYFVTTHWSVVLSAGQGDPSQARDALSQLCQTYWYPLYAYVRRRGYSPQDAEDATQELFARLLVKNTLTNIRPGKGKFRSFLLAVLNNYLVDEWKRATSQKRGGGLPIVSFDAASAETRYRHEPAETATAESIFERNWALALLHDVFHRLQREHELGGKGQLFEQLKFCLIGERSSIPYAELSAKLNLSESALKVTVHRLRQRYRELLRAEVAKTVSSAVEVEEELRYLFRVIAG
jgi:RNA polymerase sigma factor (sigma-70 family)